jgi:hypothetical protein
MRHSALVFSCLMFLGAPSQAGDLPAMPAAAESRSARPIAVSERLLAIAGLDGIFQRFGETVAGSARRGGISDKRFIETWEATTREAFGRTDLALSLRASLDRELAADEATGIESFYASPAGGRVAALEALTQAIDPARQLETIAKGQARYLAASSRRQQQIEELLTLSNAEFTFALLAESLRGMALGLHLSKSGDIAVPWEEIDAGVAAQLEGMRDSLSEASRGVMAFTYAPLSDDELDAYLDFMRDPATRRFHAVTTLVIGSAIRDTMASLGPKVAEKLAAVAI